MKIVTISLSLILILPLFAIQVSAQENDNSPLGFSMFNLVFQKTEESAQETERQLDNIIGAAREFGAGDTVFAYGTECVHYFPSGDQIGVEYRGSPAGVIFRNGKHLRNTFISALKLQFEDVVKRDLGNVNLNYDELIIC